MPRMVYKMATSAEKDVFVDMVTDGWFWMDSFIHDATGPARLLDEQLRQHHWDFVSLQAQTAEPALTRERYFPAIRELCSKVREHGATPLIYQTWAYKDGTEKLETTGMGYQQFYEALKEGCQLAAAETGTDLVPVGDVFMKLCAPAGPLEMICDEDDFHPTLLGSYAAAACFYCRIFGTDTIPTWKPKSMSRTKANQIWEAVLDVMRT